jgi:hypothetical protein
MRLQIPPVTLDKSHNVHKILATKNIMWHQVETSITSRCDLHPLFIQLTFSLCGIVIYDWFLQLKNVMTYAYVAQSFVINFMTKM